MSSWEATYKMSLRRWQNLWSNLSWHGDNESMCSVAVMLIIRTCHEHRSRTLHHMDTSYWFPLLCLLPWDLSSTWWMTPHRQSSLWDDPTKDSWTVLSESPPVLGHTPVVTWKYTGGGGSCSVAGCSNNIQQCLLVVGGNINSKSREGTLSHNLFHYLEKRP
jgi:hypothetical protein